MSAVIHVVSVQKTRAGLGLWLESLTSPCALSSPGARTHIFPFNVCNMAPNTHLWPSGTDPGTCTCLQIFLVGTLWLLSCEGLRA